MNQFLKSIVGIKTFLRHGLSEPEFYGDLVYKFKKIMGRTDFSDQFQKIIIRYKRIGYYVNWLLCDATVCMLRFSPNHE